MSVTGENEQGLRKIIDLTRFASIFVLLLHFYYFCYRAFEQWEITSAITDRLMKNISQTGLFNGVFTSKLIAVGLLIISLLGAQGKKDEKINKRSIAAYLLIGLLLFFGSSWFFRLNEAIEIVAVVYIAVTGIGFLLILAGGNLLSRLIKLNLSDDVFNSLNETFPQEERLLTNEYSINLPAKYNLKREARKSWINIINPFRGLLVIGSPGAGKSWFVIQHVIKQHIEKGFAMFVYDFKYDDLSRIVYNWLQQNKHRYTVKPSFYVINFDNLSVSHRCNPLDPSTMNDITDATESARTILLGLNREWINKQGDFFVESPINFVTAIIWFLRKYADGKYCTLPHVIELMQAEYDELFPVLNTQAEIEVLVNPFITAYQNDAMEQLEGQVASAKIGMARLASPQLYWVLSGNDFTLDINNPKHPKIVCVGNNPEKQQIYGAVLSLYISRLVRQVNKRGMHKCSLVFDEFPTIYFNNIDSLIATARSNKVATTLAMQDFSQLKKDYGREQADVIVNITGNIISGQVMGETSKLLSERFGKIMQDRQSVSVNRTDTSISHSKQLDSAIPASKIAALSSGEFVGMVADDPHEKIKLKMFHAEIINDTDQLNKEVSLYKEIPVVSNVTQQQVMDNFYQVKMEVKRLIGEEVEKLKSLSS
ncbi:type IV secretory system conjugative DNA transfer VirD4/TraG family protein [Lacibacter cauensis]|uniref:Type IV secretory system conjugative DNA transfer VirD4/TraG family protein n=1 Tax=Lacibacter cauensis TaxID=510947 RepID=A0A562SXC1_9BACT|nr:conjugal transfer protein MobC [Lacibacter cauensis]TWI85891.1 type IV secretory system conjugative DNA transfer VirD4/TraG family protein [Lacibacter cauensis]